MEVATFRLRHPEKGHTMVVNQDDYAANRTGKYRGYKVVGESHPDPHQIIMPDEDITLARQAALLAGAKRGDLGLVPEPEPKPAPPPEPAAPEPEPEPAPAAPDPVPDTPPAPEGAGGQFDGMTGGEVLAQLDAMPNKAAVIRAVRGATGVSLGPSPRAKMNAAGVAAIAAHAARTDGDAN